MKVLLLIDGMDIGGAETHVLTLAEALKKERADVSVICAGGAYTEALIAAGICVYYAPLKERNLPATIASIRALKKMKSKGFTVLHAHTRYTAALANFCLPQIPLVTTVHLNFCTTLLKRTLSCWGRKTLAVSADLKNYLIKEYKVSEHNISLTVNGVDPLRFPPLYSRGRHILHVSRLDRDRSACALLLCEAAPVLHAHAPHIQIHIYGTGDDMERVRAAAKSANLKAGKEIVHLFGACATVCEKMNEGAMLIGVSRAALEAACRGLPVILAGNDGYGGILTEEVYKNERNDNFCCRNKKRASADVLCADILYLLEHASFCEKIRRKISELVRKEYTPTRMARDAISAYYGALRIGAVGFYGFGNFGDEMMLRALRSLLLEKGVNVFFPLLPDKKSKLSRMRPLRCAYNLRKCDYVLFGGGNLLQNETSFGSLLYYTVLLMLCRRGTRIAACMGIGALHGKPAARISAWSLRRFSLLFMRTEADLQAARQLAPQAASRLYIACDLCLYLEETRSIEKKKNEIVAIPTADCKDDIIFFLKQMQASGTEIHIAVLFPQKDMQIADEIAKKIHATPPIVIRNADDFFNCVRDARLCICARLHGAIFSLLSHTPCLLSAHSEKNKAFIKDTETAAASCQAPSPILPFFSGADAVQKEREAAGKTYGFSEIISFFRKRKNY